MTKAWAIFSRVFSVITLMSVVFYLLSYPWFGTDSILSFHRSDLLPQVITKTQAPVLLWRSYLMCHVS